MPLIDPAFWSDRLRQTLARYDEWLVRQVAGKLLRPRGQWPVEDLLERLATAPGNAAVIDRRLQELDPASRRVLALMARSRQPRWRTGSLLELLAALGSTEGVEPILRLLEAGLLFPELTEFWPRVVDLEHWLGHGSTSRYGFVFAHPQVLARVLGEDLGLPDCPVTEPADGALTVHEADGLEWPLRLATVWQQVLANPLRRTQQGEFYKRDLDRLRTDPIINAPLAEALAEVPEPGLLAVALAKAEELLEESDGEIRAVPLPHAWDEGLSATLASLWTALPHLEDWDPAHGYRDGAGANPYPAAYLLAFLLLDRLSDGAWADPEAVEQWVVGHHPYWHSPAKPAARKPVVGLAAFLLGFAYPLRLLQATRSATGGWLVRLSPVGRWLLGSAEAPPAVPSYPQTLLVQPNLEIVAYRQGLTPGLILELSRFAAWKSLGAACTLQLQPESVYRGLQSGHNFETIVQTLARHGMRPTPPAVVESLRTWSDKRERISVYPSATLFEFASADDLTEALARGLAAVRVADRLALVADESSIDFRHFRLTGTRDYLLPPEKCVEVGDDGVTLTVDLSRSDLFLETEILRFAEPADGGAPGRRPFRLTPASLESARRSGLSVTALEDWFLQRTGRPLSPAARLLLTASDQPGAELRRELILHVAGAEVADGLMQWPGTRSLIERRVGPTALAVADEHVAELRRRLEALGLAVRPDGVE
jgi:hypothetical protein